MSFRHFIETMYPIQQFPILLLTTLAKVLTITQDYIDINHSLSQMEDYLKR